MREKEKCIIYLIEGMLYPRNYARRDLFCSCNFQNNFIENRYFYLGSNKLKIVSSFTLLIGSRVRIVTRLSNPKPMTFLIQY